MRNKQILYFILCFLMLFLIFSSPLTVQATNNRTVNITSTVDPRVVAEKSNVTITFCEVDTFDLMSITLYSYNNYSTSIKMPPGHYFLFSGMVTNDVSGYFTVKCNDFYTYSATTNIQVIIGDPNYKGEVVEKDFILGGIDREATNILRKQHGYPPIDWEEIDKQIEEGVFNLGTLEEDLNNSGYIENDGNNNNNNSNNNENDTPSTDDEVTVATQDEAENTSPTAPTNNNISEEEEEGSYLSSIIYILVVFAVVVFGIYYRRKNATLDEYVE